MGGVKSRKSLGTRIPSHMRIKYICIVIQNLLSISTSKKLNKPSQSMYQIDGNISLSKISPADNIQFSMSGKVAT